MADIASFALKLADGFSGPANAAKASVAALSTSLGSAKSGLAGYRQELSSAKLGLAAFEKQLARAKQTGDVLDYRKAFIGVADSKQKIFDLSQAIGGSKQKVFDLAQSLEGAKGGLGSSAGAAEALGPALGGVAAAAGMATVAIGALVAATGALVIKSLEVVNTNQLLAAQFEALGQQGAGSGKKTLAMLDQLSAKLPQSREELAKWTRQIEATGVTDLSKIRSELVATASAAAIMGDEAGEAYLKLQARAKRAADAHHGLKLSGERAGAALLKAGLNGADVAARMGLSVQQLEQRLKAGTLDAQKFSNALTASVTERGKGPLDVMMSSLSTLGKKAGETLSHLFDGVDTKPLTDALKSVISLGDAGKPSGEALKMGITGGLNGIIKALGHTITEGEVFFLELEVFALQTYIAFKPLIGAVDKIGDAFGSVGKKVGGLEKDAGVDPAAVKSVGLETGNLFLGGFTGFLPQMVEVAFDAISSIGNAKAQEVARQQGVAIGQATVAGIREGVDAHSPSVAAIKIGMDLGAGLGLGMEASPVPARAARTVSGNVLAGLANGGGGAQGAGNDNGSKAPMGPIHITINAPDGVTDAHELSVIGLSTALERYQIGSGR